MYRLVRKITSGGMGTIFEGEHLRLPGKRYAVKVLHAAQSPVAMQRFQREAVITSDLGHDHIVEVHDFNVENGMPYLVMEYLEGEDLARRLSKQRLPMELDQVVRITQQAALGLDAAHREGIVHRDLKPQNIFLCRRDGRDDFVKLLDFGVSKVRDAKQPITKDDMLTGTPSYMSPEQAEGSGTEVDHRTDIFALGVVTWEMLTGRRAFEAATISGTLFQVVFLDPMPVQGLRLPDPINAVLRTAMAKQKTARYPSVLVFAEALAEAAARSGASSAIVGAGSTIAPRPAEHAEVDTLVELERIRAREVRKRVLFVDDSPTMVMMVEAWLTEAGYDVIVARDGDEGAKKVESVLPDLVIADVNMPRRDGFALCRAIKANRLTGTIPVILFTRLNEATDIVNGLAAGADAFVIKGSDARDLLRQVEYLAPDTRSPHRRKGQHFLSLEERLSSLGRRAIFKRLFDAFFREVPFDVVALLVEDVGAKDLVLLGSHYELSTAFSDKLIQQTGAAFAQMAGRPNLSGLLESQLIVIDESVTWGDAEVKDLKTVMVPIMDGEDVIGCLGVFSFEADVSLDANIRFFFEIGVAAARALRRSTNPDDT
jgi:DNA-binding response OmpR family regulator/tRNA A-37 threonylcarbamoyl transferase component Bud32